MQASYPLYKPFHLATTSAGVLITTGSGVLHTININTPVVGQIITIADATTGTSGNTIAIISCLTTSPYPTSIFDVKYKTGLWLISTTGAVDLTIAYL